MSLNGSGGRKVPRTSLEAMLNLFEIPDCVASFWHITALIGLGFGVGVATGLFGVGGAFLITPMLNILLGIPYTLAAGSSLSFTIGTSGAAWSRHLRLGNVALKTMTILAGAAICGTLLGAKLHIFLKTNFGEFLFTLIMHGMFIAILTVTAAMVWQNQNREVVTSSLLAQLPGKPRITIRAAQLANISLPGLCVLGLLIGILQGLLGIGGGVLLMPAMLLIVGLTVHQSIGTGLGVVLFGSIAGAIIYGKNGQASLWIVMPLLLGSTIGVQIGVWACHKLHAAHIKKYFAILVLLTAGVIAIDFVKKLLAHHL